MDLTGQEHQYENMQIEEISETMDDTDTLYLNVSSGTPAMKSTLLVIATLAEYKFVPVQVSTPTMKLNKHEEDRENYDVVSYWELNEDNEKEFDNRCKVVKSKNLVALLKCDLIKKHVQAYDYTAALTIAEEIKDYLSQEAILLLQVANHRLKLNKSGIDKCIGDENYDFIPIKEGNKRDIFEYALGLEIKLKKEEFADFVRGITPIVADLFEIILKEKFKIKLDNYCKIVKNKYGNKVRVWDTNKLSGTSIADIFQAHFRLDFKGGAISTYHLKIIIDELSDDADFKQVVKDVNDVEQLVRNLVAHEIVSVTNEWIKGKTGFSAENVFQKIKYLMNRSGLNIKTEYWDSYNEMNQIIINAIII